MKRTTSRSSEPKEFGPVGIGAVLASIAVFISAVAAISHYHLAAERMRNLAYDASDLNNAAYAANAEEWGAISNRPRRPDMGTTDVVFSNLATKLAKLTKSVGSDANMGPINNAAADYQRGITEEFRLLESGRIDDARKLDETTVDPAFGTFVSRVGVLREQLEAEGKDADLIERWASAAIVASMVLMVVVLARGHQKRVIRENLTHAQRVGAEASERRQRALLERSTTQVVITDEQGALVEECVHVKPFAGRCECHVGVKLEDVVAPESRSAIRAAIDQIESGSSSVELELLMGEGESALVVNCTVTDYRKEPLIGGLLWTLTDVTEERRAATKLTEAHEQLNDILFLANMAAWSGPIDGSRLDYISDGCLAIFGRPAEEFVSNPKLWAETIHADDFGTQCPVAKGDILHQDGRVVCEYRIVRPDGTERWVSNTVRLIYNAEGEPVGKQGVILDITEERTRHMALSENVRRYNRTVARVPCVIYQLALHPDGSLHFTHVSPQCQDLLDLDPDDVVRDSSLYYKNIHPEDIAELNRLRLWSQTVHHEFIWEGRVMVRGEYRWFRSWAVPDSEENGISIWDGISFDITDSKRAQAIAIEKASAEQANAAKSDFLSRMSHELRTPLNAILGFSQLMQMQTVEQGQHDMLEHIVEGGRHLLALVNEILDISRIESRRIAINIENVDMARLAREVLDLMGPMATAHHVQTTILNPEPEPVFAAADPHRLRQILVNLVTNGIKYNRSGGTVTIEFAAADGRARIAVEDDGPGIAPEMRHRLFSAFDRLGADQTGIEGTGLGLALSQRLAEAMDGSIQFEESSSGGCRFVVDLPVTSKPPAVPSVDPAPREPAPPLARTVVYVEDNFSNAELMKSVVRQINVDLHNVANGREGIEQVKTIRPDLVLLDLDLPDIPGLEVLTALKSDPATSQIPVVIVSADASVSRMTMASEAGAATYVTKPFDVPRLLSIIQYGPEGDY